MIITLDVYSGRQNPSWRLSAKDASQLIERVADRAVASVEAGDGVLGYRGFVVSAASDDELPSNLPQAFRVGGGLVEGHSFSSAAKPLSESEAGEAAGFLLETGVHTLEHGLVEYVSHSMRSKPKTEALSEAEWPQPAESRESALPVEAEAAAPCVIANTPYNPGFWNVPAVQPKNNCYNYAMNYRSDTFAQPGRITGHQWTAINCANVGNAAAWDGCKTTCSGSNKLVALVIAPGPGFIDYHWYRRHSEGFWGHKPGGTAARNVDNSGLLINGTTRTPANCNRGPYTIFCGYRYSPTGMHVS